jgi:pimeloyl-ACP methyl ester carboxylesterase
MSRLGYDRYGAQGGDVGAVISPDLGRVDPDHVAGVHVNAATIGFMPFPPLEESELAALSDAEQARVARIAEFLDDEFGYAQIQSTRPQTLAYGLTDSPVGQLAWIVEKFQAWTHSSEVPEDAVDRDRMLTNVMLYWLTGTAGSSASIYYEDKHSGAWPQPSGVPTGVALFAEDISIRRYAEQSNNIVRWSEFDRGGHFAALEAPDLLVGDVREFFRPHR